MADRTVRVRLEANVDGFTGKMRQAERSATELANSVKRSARDNRADWEQVGGAVTKFGVGLTGASVAVAAMGVSYNSLQQRSRAALTTLTGGAIQANRQMDKLDEFARTSPFSKSTFIDAQQQMLGFGIEAKKVIPYLGSIQDAVAATGGSNQDIAELTRIFSQVQSSAKITATDLMQFGQRGVDAATLIGSQMGKTGAQIREDITAGSLSADKALDALAAGMQDRFGGAAANVKETWDGATDRVKAAFRDISANIMEPFVSAQGGGMLVDLANNVANLMRVFEGLPQPVQTTIGALGGLTGVAALAAGGFLTLAPRALDTWDALKRLGMDGGKAKGVLSGAGKAAGIAAAAFAAAAAAIQLHNKSIEDSVLSADKLERNFKLVAGAGKSVDEIFSDMRTGNKYTVSEFKNLGDAIAVIDPQFGDLRGHLRNFGADILGVDNGLKDTRGQIEAFSEGLAGMVEAGDLDGASKIFNEMVESAREGGKSMQDLAPYMDAYVGSLLDVASEAGVAISEQEALNWALTGVEPAAVTAARGLGGFAKSIGEIQSAAASTAEAVSEVASEIHGLSDVNTAAYKALDKGKTALEDLKKAAEGAKGGLDTATAAGASNAAVLAENAKAGMESVAAMGILGKSQEEIRGGYKSLYDQLVATGTAMGGTKTEAEDLARSIMGIPDGVSVEAWMDDSAKRIAEETKASVEDIPSLRNVDVIVTENGGAKLAQDALQSIEDRTVGVAVTDQGTIMEVQGGIHNVEGKTEFLLVDDNGTVRVVQERIDKTTGKTEYVYVDDDGTVRKVQGQINGIKGKDVAVKVSDNGSASAVQRYINSISGKSVSINIRRTITTLETKMHGQGRAAMGRKLPRRSLGGQLPYTGLGTDKILGVNGDGHPTVWVDDGEWVIRRRQAEKFNGLLNRVNMDHPSVQHLAGYAGGGRPGRAMMSSPPVASRAAVPTVASSGAGFDYSRLAGAVLDAVHAAPVQTTVAVDGKKLLSVMASAQHSATRGRPSSPLLGQG